MIVLGVHGGYKAEQEDDPLGHNLHDGAAVVIRDGEVLAAIEEERLNRIKHSNCFPLRAIRQALSLSGLTLDEVDRIAVNVTKNTLEQVEQRKFIRDVRAPLPARGKNGIAALFESHFGKDYSSRFRYCHHHVAHAWSAYGPSGFDKSLIYSVDGSGDNSSGMVLAAEGTTLRVLRDFSIGQSLGALYESLIRVLGYQRFDEYKVMGLAPYGDPAVYEEVFRRGYQLLPEGNYSLQPPAAWFLEFAQAGILQHTRRRGEQFTQVHKDFAAALQVTLERIVFHVLEYHRQKTGMKRLCMAGGVAHNCTLNGKILTSGLFEEVWIQPAAHDAGGALGAAWWTLYTEQPQKRRPTFEHVFLGSPAGETEAVRRMLGSWGDLISFEQCDDVARVAAERMADGEVIGWVQGRSEFGPRALGNRSILADPRPAENKSRINAMVKKREGYRPFAPSILEERAGEYFNVPATQQRFPYMIFILPVREEKRPLLGAITHVDGTARLQTVSRETNPAYWNLIHEFEKLTGVPVLLNTSFNNNAEPIVDSVHDAVSCFLTTGLDLLVVDNFVVRKNGAPASPAGSGHLAPSLVPSRKLTMQRQPTNGHGINDVRYWNEATKSLEFQKGPVALSKRAFDLLQLADGVSTFDELAARLGYAEAERAETITEMHELWSDRVIALLPPGQVQL
jgi:carbamoyltransferase